jgi:protoporphyrinogen oxidase
LTDETGGGAPSRWAIVGGGMLGLTLAHRLAQQGRRVTVLEAAPELGGLASAWQLDGVVWDRHYHVTLMSDTHLRAVLRELDLEREIEWVETRAGYFVDGRLHSISNAVELLRFPALGLLGKLRFGATIFYASKIRDWRRLERIPVASWLRRWAGAAAFERMWLPLLRSKLGEAYRETSAAFIWATIQRLYAARRSGIKKEMFGYVPGGYARVLERFGRLLKEEGVEIRLGTPVARVERTAGGVEIETLAGEVEAFDHVVVTAAAPLAARLCPGLRPEERETLQGVRYLGIVCPSVLLAKPLAGYYVTNLLDEGLPFTGVIEMSALVHQEQFGGKTLAYLPRYAAADDPVFEMSDAEVEKHFLEGLRRVYPAVGAEDVLAFRISRVRNVMPLPTLGYSTRVPATDTSVPGLHLVSSAQIVNGTLNVNETIQLAERAARHFEGMP